MPQKDWDDCNFEEIMLLARNKNVEREIVFAGKTKGSLNANQLLGITVDTF